MRKGMTRRKFMEAAAGAALSSGVVPGVAHAKKPGKASKTKSGLQPPAQPARHEITDYATVRAYSQGEPVYAFGFTYVYGVSPDLQPSVRLQEGNKRPWRKIHPKKSWEI